MRVVVLDEAERDLDDGYWFYENQQEGFGAYFLRQILSDLESLPRYAGIHRVWFVKYIGCSHAGFPSASTALCLRLQSTFMPSWICARILHPSGSGCSKAFAENATEFSLA